MDFSFWQDKRVFITGHTGFKGSYLTLWLQQLGAQVTGYSLAPKTSPNLFTLANISDGIEHHTGDIRDLEELTKALVNADPDVVIHMAAQALVRPSYQNPVETYQTNVMGTAHLLEAVRQCHNAKSVVVVTTDKCYENKEWEWGYRENEPLGGYDPYSSSKACAEIVTSAYRQSFFNQSTLVGIATARAGNVIGGGDWAEDRLIPDIMRGISTNQSVEIRNPQSIRPWQHVLEPLSGYLTLAEKIYQNSDYAEAWNFGPSDDDAKPVSYLVETFNQQWPSPINWNINQAPQPHEAHYLKLDSAKAKNRLNWKPRLSLEQALIWTSNWYQAYLTNQDMKQFTLKQIHEYQSLMEPHKEIQHV